MATPIYSYQQASLYDAGAWQTDSQDKDIYTPTHSRKVDFSMQDTSTAYKTEQTAQTVFSILLVSYRIYRITGSYLGKKVLSVLPVSIQKAISQGRHIITVNVFDTRYGRPTQLALRVTSMSLLVRFATQRLIMMIVYPGQSNLLSLFFTHFQLASNQKMAVWACNAARDRDYICRDVVLEKNGVRYSGMIVAHKDTINNGKWVVQTGGNGERMESMFGTDQTPGVDYREPPDTYKDAGFNTLLINGPSVGRSLGRATPTTMGDAIDVATSFVERALKANEIAIAGRSLGGALVAQGMLQHQFMEGKKYLVAYQMSFSKVSEVAAAVVGNNIAIIEELVKWIIRLAGCEIDSIATAKRLQTLNIRQVVLQAGKLPVDNSSPAKCEDFASDEAIPLKASLGFRLVQEGATTNTAFIRIAKGMGVNTSHLYPSADINMSCIHMTHYAMEMLKDELIRLGA